MAEQTQIQQVTTKDPEKIKVGKRLVEYNRRKREELAQMKTQKSESEAKLSYYSVGAIVATGVLGVIGYYIYQSKTPKENPVKGQLQRFPKLISNDRIWPSEQGFEVIFEKSLFVFEISTFKVRN